MRRRNSVLEAIELFREVYPAISVNSMIAFLYVCENEGANGKELAQLCRLFEPTASRSIRALASPASPTALPPAIGLVDLYSCSVGRSIVLTPAGMNLRDRIDALIAEANTIRDNARPVCDDLGESDGRAAQPAGVAAALASARASA